MKTYSRFRTPKELRAACKRAGFSYNQDQFERGSDHVSFRFKHGKIFVQVVFSAVNGQAFGEFWTEGKDKRAWFTTNETKRERCAWFKALLKFIYVD